MVHLFKNVVARTTTHEGRNDGEHFAPFWKRRLSIIARTATTTHATANRNKTTCLTSERDNLINQCVNAIPQAHAHILTKSIIDPVTTVRVQCEGAIPTGSVSICYAQRLMV